MRHLSLFIIFLVISACVGEDEIIETDPIGNIFTIGMLYDERSGVSLPSMSLWDRNTISNNTVTQNQPYVKISMKSSTTYAEKVSILNLDADVEIKVLGMKIASGGGGIATESRSSYYEESMAMSYQTTSEFDYLTMEALGGITEISSAYLDMATHVVTGILYGNTANFQFSRAYSENTNVNEVTGELKSLLSGIELSSSVGDLSSELATVAEGTTIKFYGDFQPDKNPGNLEDVLDLYSRLPSLLSVENESKGRTPVKVWLYPLSKLTGTTKSLVSQSISSIYTELATNIVSELEIATASLNDYLMKTVGKFPHLYDNIKEFKKMILLYKTSLSDDIQEAFTQIKSNTAESSVLQQIFDDHENTYFSETSLNDILSTYNLMITLLETNTNSMTEIIGSEEDYHEKLGHTGIDYVISLELNTNMVQGWLNLDTFTSSINDIEKAKISGDFTTVLTKFLDSKSLATIFKDFYEVNKDQNIFIIQEVNQEDFELGNFIYITTPSDEKRSFKPLSKPRSITANYDDGQQEITVTWEKPEYVDEDMAISNYDVYNYDFTSQEWKLTSSVMGANVKSVTYSKDDLNNIGSTYFKVVAWYDDPKWRSPDSDVSTITILTDKSISCTAPSVTNGITNKETVLVGSDIVIYCTQNYYLKGAGDEPGKLTCTDENQFNKDIPTCEVAGCLKVTFANGELERTSSTNYGNTIFAEEYYQPGEIVDIECDSGYNPKSTETLTCQDVSYTWNIKEANIGCDLVLCTAKNIANGKVNRVGSNFRVGESVKYTCNKNYIITPQYAQYTCTDDGSWDNGVPTCEYYKQCTNLASIPNMSFVCIGCKYGLYVVGSKVVPTCNSNYIYVGYTTFYCTRTGTYGGWTQNKRRCIDKKYSWWAAYLQKRYN